MPKRPPEYWSNILATKVDHWQREHESGRLYAGDDLELIVGELRDLGGCLAEAYREIEEDRSLTMFETKLAGFANRLTGLRADTVHWHPEQLREAFDWTLHGLREAARELATGEEQAN